MKFNPSKYTTQLLAAAMAVIAFASCNKDDLDAVPIEQPAPSGQTIAQLLDDPSFSLLKKAAVKAGMLAMLADSTAVYTVFAPDDAALARSGISSAIIDALPATQIASILQYHIVGGQRIGSSALPTSFPNLQLPTELVLAPPSPAVPPGLRMSVFPSKRGNVAWANYVPLTAVDIQARNGIIHKTAGLLLPPQAFLWDRISTDPNLTYLKAAIQRADEGATPGSSLQEILKLAPANLTVFAPTNAAMQQFLIGAITQALITNGLPPATAQAAATLLVTSYGPTIISNPASIPDPPIFPNGTNIGAALAATLTPTKIKGLVVYHILGTRAFSVNLPTTEAAFPTLLNQAIANHPGIKIQATFGPTGVTAATVKGAANGTASNVSINPTPSSGTSDQLYINGVIHIIDQVLLPQ